MPNPERSSKRKAENCLHLCLVMLSRHQSRSTIGFWTHHSNTKQMFSIKF